MEVAGVYECSQCEAKFCDECSDIKHKLCYDCVGWEVEDLEETFDDDDFEEGWEHNNLH